tara:strand:+ start:962 stop:2308 length:1347 start_codon:yes stop_codon:yes gene_type:complete
MNDSNYIDKNKIISRQGGALAGSLIIPGDKSISHRALILASLSIGETEITGLLEGEDVLRTADALRGLGVIITKESDAKWKVNGVGIGGLSNSEGVIELGNSGTSARLLTGVLAGYGFQSILTGDSSLIARPMDRVINPLRQMGAMFYSNSEKLPLTIIGSDNLMPLNYELPVASAQVKSAILLAGLHAPGETTIIEPKITRDHTERMLKHFGADIQLEDKKIGRLIKVKGQPDLKPSPIIIPSDPSSAAFPTVAATLVSESEVIMPRVCINPTRMGFYTTLSEMGASIKWINKRTEAGEPIADLIVKSSLLNGTEVPADRAPLMIDEYPVLAVAAACAKGKTIFKGIGELRHKESDRVSAIADGLKKSGVRVEESEEELIIYGDHMPPEGGNKIFVSLDHRIAMSFLVLGLVSKQPISIDDGRSIETSFPNFVGLMRSIGANIVTDK